MMMTAIRTAHFTPLGRMSTGFGAIAEFDCTFASGIYLSLVEQVFEHKLQTAINA